MRKRSMDTCILVTISLLTLRFVQYWFFLYVCRASQGVGGSISLVFISNCPLQPLISLARYFCDYCFVNQSREPFSKLRPDPKMPGLCRKNKAAVSPLSVHLCHVTVS